MALVPFKSATQPQSNAYNQNQRQQTSLSNAFVNVPKNPVEFRPKSVSKGGLTLEDMGLYKEKKDIDTFFEIERKRKLENLKVNQNRDFLRSLSEQGFNPDKYNFKDVLNIAGGDIEKATKLDSLIKRTKKGIDQTKSRRVNMIKESMNRAINKLWVAGLGVKGSTKQLGAGRISGFLKEYFTQPTGLDIWQNAVEGLNEEVVTALSRMAAGGGRLPEGMVERYKKTLPNKYSNYGEIANQFTLSYINAITDNLGIGGANLLSDKESENLIREGVEKFKNKIIKNILPFREYQSWNKDFTKTFNNYLKEKGPQQSQMKSSSFQEKGFQEKQMKNAILQEIQRRKNLKNNGK